MSPEEEAACSSACAADPPQLPHGAAPPLSPNPQLLLRAARNKQAALALRRQRIEQAAAGRVRTAHNKSLALAKRAARVKPPTANAGWKITNATNSHFGTNDAKSAANTTLTTEQRARVACSTASAASSANSSTASDALLQPRSCEDNTDQPPPLKQARLGISNDSSGEAAAIDCAALRHGNNNERKLTLETTTISNIMPTTTDFVSPPPLPPEPPRPRFLLQGAAAVSDE